jgi:hypothetical protein
MRNSSYQALRIRQRPGAGVVDFAPRTAIKRGEKLATIPEQQAYNF